MKLEIRRLAPTDDRSQFRSGNIELDRFFALYAGQNQFKHHLGTTYVATHDGRIEGFATVTASELASARVPGRRAAVKYPLPVLRLARLAVSERSKGRGVGRQLVSAVFTLAVHLSEDVGCVGVVVDTKENAVRFYESLGFVALDVVAGGLGDRPAPAQLFIAIGVIVDSTR